MPSTYTPIATQTLGSSAATVTFSSISGSYTDIVLVASVNASAASDVKVRVNGLTTSIYSNTIIYGSGTVAGSYRNSTATLGGTEPVDTAASTFTPKIINFMNYANTTTFKSYLAKTSTSSSTNGATATVGLIQTTSAINSITLLYADSTTFSAGSTFSLYGIKAA
jgi:hypothetical protein